MKGGEKMKKPEKNTLPIKVYKSILENYNLIKSKRYTEKNIKDLLIDLRFVATTNRKVFRNSKFEEDLNEFIDFCNFIAHPIKDRGFIAKRIIENINLLKESLIDPNGLIQFQNGKLYFDKLKTYSSSNYVTYMLTMIFLVLQNTISQYELQNVLDSESKDISLCILSLLQNSVIELDKQDTEKATLMLNSNNNYLFLYSVIYSEKIDIQLKESEFNPNTNSSLFLLPTVTSDISHIKVNQTNREQPQFYETYRDSFGKLNLRLI